VSTNHDANGGVLEDNIRTLLCSAEPDLSLPQADKMRILSVLTARRAKAPSAPHRWAEQARAILKNRLGRYAAVAAAAAIVLAVMNLRTGDSRNGLAWADVVRQVTSAKTLVWSLNARGKAPSTSSAQEWMPAVLQKEYYNDRGMSRREIDTPQGRKIIIMAVDPNECTVLTLYPRQKKADRCTTIGYWPGYSPGGKSPFGGPFDAGGWWGKLKGVTSNMTRKIGEREIKGVRTVGFEAPIQAILEMPKSFPTKGWVHVWVDRNTALPLLIEAQFEFESTHFVQEYTYGDIQWNATLSDDLFSLTPPAGYKVSEVNRRFVPFKRTSLKSNVTLRVRSKAGEELITERNIEAIPFGVATESDLDEPSPNKRREMSVYPELTETAKERLMRLLPQDKMLKLIVDFNGELKVETVFDFVHNMVPLEITSMGKTLEQFENEYLAEKKEAAARSLPTTKPR
jgi:hypothetical protein